MFANGEHRIGMYATSDIAPQAELFFDYGYDTEIKSEHLHKRAIKTEWMQDGKMANQISNHVGREFHDPNAPPSSTSSSSAKRKRGLGDGGDELGDDGISGDSAIEVEPETAATATKKAKRKHKVSAYAMFLRDADVREEVRAAVVRERRGGAPPKSRRGHKTTTKKEDDMANEEVSFVEMSKAMARRWTTLTAADAPEVHMYHTAAEKAQKAADRKAKAIARKDRKDAAELIAATEAAARAGDGGAGKAVPPANPKNGRGSKGGNGKAKSKKQAQHNKKKKAG